MSYNVDNIVIVTAVANAKGLATANFAIPMLMGTDTDNTGTSTPLSTYLDFSTPAEVAVYYPVGTETYKAAVGYLGGSPTSAQLSIFKRDPLDTWTESLDKQRNLIWRYLIAVTKDTYDEVGPYTDLIEIAQWAQDQKMPTLFANCQSSALNVAAIRDSTDSSDICSLLTAAGLSRTFTLANTASTLTVPGTEVSNYAALREFKWFAAVNYNAFDSTITGQFRVLEGVTAETLTTSEYNAMELATKNCMFYTIITAPGSTAGGGVINAKTASGAWLDDIVNLDAFVNSLTITLFNVLIQYPKTPYTPAGFQTLITAAQQVGEQYISNGYLGPRNYTKDNGEVALTNGYEVLTKADQILDASALERTDRKSPPIQMQIYTAGAIHIVSVDVGVF